MENWARANFILSSRKKNILVDRQNFEYKFKRESETGARYWVCRLRDSLGCTATASTIERSDATLGCTATASTIERNDAIYIYQKC